MDISSPLNNSENFVRNLKNKFSLGKFDDINDSFSFPLFSEVEEKDKFFIKAIQDRHLNYPLTLTWLDSFHIRKSDNKLINNDFTHWTPFQYWSQGTPPKYIQRITNVWNHIFKKIGVPQIKLYDKISATDYINKYCPELITAFKTSFHFAIEADIFRIAYAQNNNCIWIDSDLYPSAYTKDILSHILGMSKTTLLFQHKQPVLTNAFFATPASSLFFKTIFNSVSGYDFSSRPKNADEIVHSFGPGRFNATLANMFARVNNIKDFSNALVSNYLTDQVTFINSYSFYGESPFELRYKKTNASWIKKYVRRQKRQII